MNLKDRAEKQCRKRLFCLVLCDNIQNDREGAAAVPRKPDGRIAQAEAMYRQGAKLIDIARQLGLPEGTVRRWKCTHKWDSERSDKKSERSVKRKRGAQPGNHNATGPPGNKNAEKYGFFSKYLPEETREIFSAIEDADPLDLLWHQVQIAYAAIIRAQRIAYVKNQQDKTIEKVEEKTGNVIGEKWEVQQAWDKQNEFMKSQARAQSEFRSLLKQYEEMLHKNWELASEEQKTRIAVMKAKAQLDDGIEAADDGFLEALAGTAPQDWADEEKDTDI